MKKIINKLARRDAGVAANILASLLTLAAYAISWLIICGLFWVIMYQAKQPFNITVATALWLLVFAGKNILHSVRSGRHKCSNDSCFCDCHKEEED